MSVIALLAPRLIQLDDNSNPIRIIEIPVPWYILRDKIHYVGPGPMVTSENTERVLEEIQTLIEPLVQFYKDYHDATGLAPEISPGGRLYLPTPNAINTADINTILNDGDNYRYRFYTKPRPRLLYQDITGPVTEDTSSSESSSDSGFGKISYKQADKLYEKYKKLYKSLTKMDSAVSG